MPPGISLPQGLEIVQAPVVGREQIVQQPELLITAVLQPFFTSVMVILR